MSYRRVYNGEKAKRLYNRYTQLVTPNGDHCFTDFGPPFDQVGGYWLDEASGFWVAFDFTDGYEVFIENFNNEQEAFKYASGEVATTADGLTI